VHGASDHGLGAMVDLDMLYHMHDLLSTTTQPGKCGESFLKDGHQPGGGIGQSTGLDNLTLLPRLIFQRELGG